ncbi:MAG: glycosyltransferase [Thermomicrobiales bacterium]|nr:glycosyltransferase [Thermomicrobiales bacterium]
MTIRVVHLITGLGVGGAETMLARLVEHSDRRRFTHRVVSMSSAGPMADRIAASGVRVHSLDMRPGAPDPRAVLRLTRDLKHDRPHVLQAWMYHANLLAMLAGPLAGKPVVWNLRATPDFDYGRQVAMIRRVSARLARFPAAVVANSASAMDAHVRDGFGAATWRVIPNGFDTTTLAPNREARYRVRAEWGIADDVPVIGLVARLDPVKDHATFLEAAGVLSRRYPQARFVCVGTGPDAWLRYLQELAVSKGLSPRVIWAGHRSDVAAVNNALDIATSASVSESFPNAIGEAMACGTPCVVTNVGDSARLVGDTGLVVPPGDALAIARAWESLLRLGDSQRHELATQARLRIAQHYSLDTVVHQYESLYTDLAGSA